MSYEKHEVRSPRTTLAGLDDYRKRCWPVIGKTQKEGEGEYRRCGHYAQDTQCMPRAEKMVS